MCVTCSAREAQRVNAVAGGGGRKWQLHSVSATGQCSLSSFSIPSTHAWHVKCQVWPSQSPQTPLPLLLSPSSASPSCLRVQSLLHHTNCSRSIAMSNAYICTCWVYPSTGHCIAEQNCCCSATPQCWQCMYTSTKVLSSRVMPICCICLE